MIERTDFNGNSSAAIDFVPTATCHLCVSITAYIGWRAGRESESRVYVRILTV